MEYGYVRSATGNRESLEEQVTILKGYGIENIIEEKTGKDLPELLDKLQEGDTLRVSSVDRLTRDANKLLALTIWAEDKGFNLYAGDQKVDMTALRKVHLDL